MKLEYYMAVKPGIGNFGSVDMWESWENEISILQDAVGCSNPHASQQMTTKSMYLQQPNYR